MRQAEFLESCKATVTQRNELLIQKEEIIDTIKRGKAFFQQQLSNVDMDKIYGGVSQINRCLDQLLEIERQLFDLDTTFMAFLESIFVDSHFKITTETTVSEAGDLHVPKTVIFSPKKEGIYDFIEVSPDDIWALKQIKAALKPKNIEIIQGNKYLDNIKEE